MRIPFSSFALGLALSTVVGAAWADVTVTGTVDHLRIEARGAPIVEVMEALKRQFGIAYRYDARPDWTVDGTFTGSLSSILPRVFRNRDYIFRIEPNHSMTVFFPSPSSAPMPSPQGPPSADAPTPSPQGTPSAAAPIPPPQGTPSAAAPIPPPQGTPSAAAPIPPPQGTPSAAAPIPPPQGTPSAAAPIPPPQGPPSADAPIPPHVHALSPNEQSRRPSSSPADPTDDEASDASDNPPR